MQCNVLNLRLIFHLHLAIRFKKRPLDNYAIAKFNHVFGLEVSSLLCRGVNPVIVLVLLGPLQYLSRGKHCVEYRTRHVKSGSDEKHSLPLGLRLLQVTIKCRFKLKSLHHS